MLPPSKIDSHNKAQTLAKQIKGFDSELLWALVNHANASPPLLAPPPEAWPFEAKDLAPVLVVQKNAVGADVVKEMWMGAEVRTALAMAQRLDSTTSFYDNMRLQHRTVAEAVSGSKDVPLETYQGDGRKVFRTYIDHLATVEIERTRLILNESVGWVLMFDGMNKGNYATKGEMVMAWEVSAEGIIRVRCMHLLFLKKAELVEYKRLQVKPFGASAQWAWMRDATQERYCQGERPVAAGADFLPSVFRNLLQVSTDGASVMHTFQSMIRNNFIPDLIPGIDDPHQLERCLVHALREQPYALEVLDCVRLVVKTFRKQELLSM